MQKFKYLLSSRKQKKEKYMIELYQEYDNDMYKRSARVLMKKIMTIMLILGVVILALSIPSYFERVLPTESFCLSRAQCFVRYIF